jgi:large repetitive protein
MMTRHASLKAVMACLAMAVLAVPALAQKDSYSLTVLADGPVGYWRLDEPYGGQVGTVCDRADAPGSPQQGPQHGVHMRHADGDSASLDGYYTAGPRPSSGYNGFPDNNFGYWFKTDGVGPHSCHYIEVPDSPEISPTGDLTIEAWINIEDFPSASATYAGIVTKYQNSVAYPNNRSYGLIVDNNGKLRFYISANGTSGIYVTMNNALSLGTWYHVSAVFSSATPSMKIYVNGNEEATTASGAIPSSVFDADCPLQIGAFLSVEDFFIFRGIIDEPALYARALSGPEVAAHYAARATDYPAAVLAAGPVGYWRLDEVERDFPTEGTVTGCAKNSASSNGYLDASYVLFEAGEHTNEGPRPIGFRGFAADNACPHFTSDFAQTPSNGNYIVARDAAALDITGDLTLEAWVYFEQTPADNAGILAKLASGDYAYGLYTKGGTRQIRFTVSSDGTSATAYLTTDAELTLNQWYHVAAVYDAGSSLAVYTNGVTAAGTLTGTVPNALNASGANLWIGMQYLLDDRFQFYGKIDEAAVYNKALSASDILRHYRAGVLGSSGGTLFLLR